MAKIPTKLHDTKYTDVQKSKTPGKVGVNPAKGFAYPNNKKPTTVLAPKNVGLPIKTPAKEGFGLPFRSDCSPPAKYRQPEKEDKNFPQFQSSEVSENGSENLPNSATNSNPISLNETSQVSSVKQPNAESDTGINDEERSEKLDLDTFTVRLNRRRKHQRHRHHHLHRRSDLQGSQFALRGPANILKKARGYFSSIFGGEQPDSQDSQNAEKSSKDGFDSISSKIRSEKSEIDDGSEEAKSSRPESTRNDDTNSATVSKPQSEASSRSSRNLNSDFETIRHEHFGRSEISSKGSPTDEQETASDYENFSTSTNVSRVPKVFNDIYSDEFGEIATERFNFSEIQTGSKSVSESSMSYSSFTEETIDLDSGATLIDIPSEILDVSERTWRLNPDKFPRLKIANKIVPLEKGSTKGSVKSTQKRTTMKTSQIKSEKLLSGKSTQKEKKKGKSSHILKQKKKEKVSKKKEQKKKKKTSKHSGMKKNSTKHKNRKNESVSKKKRSKVKKNTAKKDKVSNKKAKPVDSKLKTESNQKVRKKKSKKSKRKSKSKAKKSKSKLKSKSKDKSKSKLKSKSKEKQQIKKVKSTAPSQDQINDVKRRRSSSDQPQTRFERYLRKKRMSKVHHIKLKQPKENENKEGKKVSKAKQDSKKKENKQNM